MATHSNPPSESGEGDRRPPFLAMPYPLDEYLDSLPGDYAKIARRLLRGARARPGVMDGMDLDAGEALIDERSEKIWGGLCLDRRSLAVEGRRALIRRVLESLERDGIIERRAARTDGPDSSPRNGPRGGPSPTVVRFLKFREILWPVARSPGHPAQEAAQRSTQESARACGPIPPVDPPDPPVPEGESAAVSLRALSLDCEARLEGPSIGDLRAVLAMSEHAFEEVTGVRYQHAQPQAVRADRRAAAELLAATGRSVETVEMVWRWALQQPNWPRIETLADLAQHWGRVAPRAFAARKRAESNPAASMRVAGPGDSCPVWAEISSDLKRRLRPDLFERWFAPLNAVVDGEDLRLLAPDEFHKEFMKDNYQAFLEQEMETRARQGSDGRKLHLRIVTSQSPAMAAAVKEG